MIVTKKTDRTKWVIGASLAATAMAVVLWCNYNKAVWVGIQGWGRPYWWLDYSHGLVRRGLVGELFQLAAGRRDESHLIAPVDMINACLCAGLACAFLWLAFRSISRQNNLAAATALAALGVWFSADELWPTLAYNQGYLDVFVLSWAMTGAFLLRAGRVVLTGIVLAVGPFIHEYFLFLVPFILTASPFFGSQVHVRSAELESLDVDPEVQFPRHLFVLGAIAALAAAIVTFGASSAAARIEIATMPLPAETREVLSNTTLSQTLGQSFSLSASQLVQDPAYTLQHFLFFYLPALLNIGVMLFWKRKRPDRGVGLRAAAALFPLLALLLAWDLSRLLCLATLPAAALMLMTAEDEAPATELVAERPRLDHRLMLSGALFIAALGYLAAPMAYVYYEPTPATLFPLRVWPGDGYRTWGFGRLWPNARNSGSPPRTGPQ